MSVGWTFRKLVKIAAVVVAVLPSLVQAFIPLHEADGSVQAIVDNQATFGQFAIGDPVAAMAVKSQAQALGTMACPASALIYSIPDVQTLGDDNASFDEKGSAGVRIGINVATVALGIGAQRMSSPQGSALSSVESAAIRGGRPIYSCKVRNSLLPSPTRSNPVAAESFIISVELPKGFVYNQAVSPNQKMPGRFGTLSNIPDLKFARQNLAITLDFKKEISGVRQVIVERPIRAQFSIVGEQTDLSGRYYPGHATQLETLDYDPNQPFVRFFGEEIIFND